MAEKDTRKQLLNSFISCSHRDKRKIYPIHQELHDGDPDFYSHLASWYFDTGEGRDIKEVFASILSVSKFGQDIKNVGHAIIDRLPPRQVANAVSFIGEQIVKIRDESTKKHKEVKIGMKKNIPSSLKTAIEKYLRRREKTVEALDTAIISSRKSVKKLYQLSHTKPSSLAQKILFDNNPPEGTNCYILKQISKSSDVNEKINLYLNSKIPFVVARPAMGKIDAVKMAALLGSMTPQQVINTIHILKKFGLDKIPSTRQLIKQKLTEAKTDKRVSAYKAKKAIESANVDGDLAKELDDVTEAQIKNKGTIKPYTAIVVDKSGSMHEAVEVGKRVASMVAAISEKKPELIFFDSIARKVELTDYSLSAIEKACARIFATGNTSIGSPIRFLKKNGIKVEQICIITDQGENTEPYFESEIKDYMAEIGKVSVTVINIGCVNARPIEEASKKLGLEINSWDFKGDYYSLPDIIPLLQRKTADELLEEIMKYPLLQPIVD